MPEGDVDGAEKFSEFADNCEEMKARVPNILQEATENTVKELRREIVKQIAKGSTSKGGTLDSRTSPYSPGGENESSTDNFHISDPEAWRIVGPASTGEQVFVTLQPKVDVKDRAKAINYGTPGEGASGGGGTIEPDGETPFYFKYRGITIVVSDSPIENPDGSMNPIENRFEGEPYSIDGVEPQNYWGKAFETIQSENVLQDELNKEFSQALHDSFTTG
jgi:hypothetical protein